MKNVTYIISNINKALAFEWIAHELNKEKIKLSFVLLNPSSSELEIFLIQAGFNVIHINYHGKKSIPLALLKIIKFLKQQKTEIVHTHLFDANLVGLTAAKLCGIKKRIYTRHHSSYHHEFYPHAVKYDKYCNYLATNIIAITNTVKDILTQKENVAENKITIIEHGFKLSIFEHQDAQTIQALKIKYQLHENQHPIIGVISRYTEWKGIQYIIPAFKQLLQSYPSAVLVLANATGDYKNEIKLLLQDIPTKNYIEIEFESQLGALYQLFDVFVHTPIDNHSEAFGQTYVEALSAGIPSVFTLSGIANDFIVDEKNALVVDYKSSSAILNAITELLNNKTLKNELIKQGKIDVNKTFELHKMIYKLEELYLK